MLKTNSALLEFSNILIYVTFTCNSISARCITIFTQAHNLGASSVATPASFFPTHLSQTIDLWGMFLLDAAQCVDRTVRLFVLAVIFIKENKALFTRVTVWQVIKQLIH